MRYLLVDNGSLRADSVLNLRQVARGLGEAVGLEILPSSLLHSSKVPPEELDGEPAVNLERRLRLFLEAGERDFTLIPFFFGPTGAITDYLPQRLASLRARHGGFRAACCPFLFMQDDPAGNDDLVALLAGRVRETVARRALVRPRVALVDHGSPLAAVTAVRDALAARLADALGDAVACVAPASMERRDGDAYAFNEPLLANQLDRPGWNTGDTVIALLFLSPGRHAGPDGDIAAICTAARDRHPGLATHMTGLVGTHPAIVPLLIRRLNGPKFPL